MSRLYGTLKGSRGEATRAGHNSLVTHAAGWKGAIRVEVTADGDVDRYRVLLTPWQQSGGVSRVLCEGVLDAQAANTTPAQREATIWQAMEKLREAAESQP